MVLLLFRCDGFGNQGNGDGECDEYECEYGVWEVEWIGKVVGEQVFDEWFECQIIEVCVIGDGGGDDCVFVWLCVCV